MSRGTVDPERSNHNRMVSADVDCVVTRRICRTELCQRYVRGLLIRSGRCPPRNIEGYKSAARMCLDRNSASACGTDEYP